MNNMSLGIIKGILKQWPFFLFLFAALTLILFLKSKKGKGWAGEKAVATGMWLALDSKIYRRIDDVIIYTSSGTTQTDHIVVSK